MPLLDVSELMSDPLFVETFDVIRRREVINAKGRVEIVGALIEGVLGSVQPKDTAIGGNIITQGPDASLRGANFNVYTAFRLRSVSKTAPDGTRYLPDVVVWNGDHLLVALINDYSHYGAGYLHAECASIDAVDYAPDGGPP